MSTEQYTPKETHFTHPSHLEHLPAPSFEFLFHLECKSPRSTISSRTGPDKFA
jgi:hypothetical protein